MTFDMSQKLMRLANYFNIGMTMFEVQESGNIRQYTLRQIKVNILSNEIMHIIFICENQSNGADEYFSYKDLDNGTLFIFEPMANEQSAKNMVKYYGGVKDENNK